jgi:hypothetical protein
MATDQPSNLNSSSLICEKRCKPRGRSGRKQDNNRYNNNLKQDYANHRRRKQGHHAKHCLNNKSKTCRPIDESPSTLNKRIALAIILVVRVQLQSQPGNLVVLKVLSSDDLLTPGRRHGTNEEGPYGQPWNERTAQQEIAFRFSQPSEQKLHSFLGMPHLATQSGINA